MQRLNGFLALALGLAASAFAFYWLRRPPAPVAAEAHHAPFILPVTLEELVRGTLRPSIELTGAVVAARRSRLAFDATGWLAIVSVRDGDRVAEGDELARLDDTAEVLGLSKAQKDLQLAERELDSALAGERVEVIERLRAQVVSARADLAIANLNLGRGAELLEGRVVSAATQDANIAVRDAASGRLTAAEQALAEAVVGTRQEDLAVARARVEVAEALVALARRELHQTRIFAPWPGVVVRRLLDAGDFAAAGAAVFDLIDLEHLEVELEVPASVGRSLPAGAAVSLVARSGESIATTVDVVIPVADPASRNYRALVRLSRGDPGFDALRPGQFVRATVDLAPIVDALLAPVDAIRLVDGGEILVLAEAIPGAEPPQGPPTGPPTPWLEASWVPIRRLASADGLCAVESLGPPIEVGDLAVMTGVDRAFPGVALMPAGGDH